MNRKILICLPFMLGACAIAPSPSIIAFNNSSVTVRDGGLANKETSIELSMTLAAERCGVLDKSAKHVSSSVFTEGPYDSKQDHLFVCE